jgi:predicted NBD/HSP70 family sugar kinase
MRTGDLKLIQELNRSIILNTIRKHGPISRSEIAKMNKISPTTVATAVQDMIKEGFVDELGAGVSNGGRKPIMVSFAPNNFYLISVSISNSIIEAAHVNLEAKILSRKSLAVKQLYGEEVIQAAIGLIDQLNEEYMELNKCIGISVAVPGIVDHKEGIVRYNSKLQLQNIAIKDILAERYGVKVWVENDMNAIVLAEKQIGNRHYSDMIYVTVGDGVGAGIIINDAVLRGKNGGASEFGHTSVDRSGIRCECGNYGCLENYISWPAVYGRIVTSISRGRHSILAPTGEPPLQLTPEMFHEAVLQGDTLAVDITEEIAGYLGPGLVNLINLFNPEAIILGGELILEDNMLFERVHSYVAKHALTLNSGPLQIVTSSLGKDAKLVGAASMLLQDFFRFSLSSQHLK